MFIQVFGEFYLFTDSTVSPADLSTKAGISDKSYLEVTPTADYNWLKMHGLTHCISCRAVGTIGYITDVICRLAFAGVY